VQARTQRRVRRRRQFWVKGPNRVWSVDGHDKLSRFGFEIYGAIDAYSRYVVWCFVGHSNRTAVSVNKQYLLTVQKARKIPKLIRSDMGTETILLCHSQLILRRALKPGLPFRKIYSWGTSTKNQRIESWWNLLTNAQTETYRELFLALEHEGYFDGSEVDKLCLQFIYMEMLRKHIYGFVCLHNTHRIRHQRNRGHYLPTGRPHQMYHHPRGNTRDYADTPDEFILEALLSQLEAYDIDEYMVPETRMLFERLLSANGFPVRFSWEDNHVEAYIFLRQALLEHISNTGGDDVKILQKPEGAEKWILQNYQEILEEQEKQQRRKENEKDFELEGTDDEEDVGLAERVVEEQENGNWNFVNDGTEYDAGFGDQNADDDGLILLL
jgi:transposase InsO family protein